MSTAERCVLDLEGMVTVPEGYTLVQNEAELWRAFAGKSPMWVRGSQELISWAKRALEGRGWSVETKANEFTGLLQSHPELGLHLVELLQRSGGTANSLSALGRILLPGIPLDGVGTNEHLFQLLKWWFSSESKLDEAADCLRCTIIDHWSNQLMGNVAESYLRLKTGKPNEHLISWFCLAAGPRETAWLRPPEVTVLDVGSIRGPIHEAVNSLLLNGNNSRIRGFFLSDAPRAVKQVAASAIVQALEQNHGVMKVDARFIDLMGPFITEAQRNELSELVTPDTPGPLPSGFDDLAEWFSKDYLPYRKWSAQTADASSIEVLEKLWPEFTRWYLEHLRSAINGGVDECHLAFRKVRKLWELAETQVVLLVVLDGLLPGDDRAVIDVVRAQDTAWEITESTFAATLVPTITEYCKTSLIHGCPPLYATTKSDEVRTRKDAINAILHGITIGHGLVVWVFDQPDWTYHGKRGAPEDTLHDVSKAIHSIGTDIASLLGELPRDAVVSMVLTSDHGRALGSCPKQLKVPDGGNAHGRSVHLVHVPPGAEPLQVQEDGIVRIDERAYGIGTGTSLVPLGEFTFSTSLGGDSWYDHGGVLPEETIVPWVTLKRDCADIRIEGKSTLQGVVGRDCELVISLSNPGSVAMLPIVAYLIQTDGSEISVPLNSSPLKPLAKQDHKVQIRITNDFNQLSVIKLEARKPSGELLLFDIPLTTNLRTMQDRKVDLTEDFEF